MAKSIEGNMFLLHYFLGIICMTFSIPYDSLKKNAIWTCHPLLVKDSKGLLNKIQYINALFSSYNMLIIYMWKDKKKHFSCNILNIIKAQNYPCKYFFC